MAGPPSIELVAAQNGAGRLAVRGSNWAPGEAVLIALEEDGETGNVLAAGIADANGEFTVGLEIRQQLLDSEGEPKVLAFTDSQDTRAQALLNQPLLSALASASDSADENVPSTGAAGIGQRRTITNTGLGSRFGQNNETTADETTDGTAEPEGRLAQLRNRLTATSTVTISGTPVSRVGAAGGAGPIAVNAYAEVTPESGGAGTQVTVTGGGFPANTTVNVHLAGLVQASDGSGSQPHIYASTTTNNNGAYSITFAMPSQWPSGSPLRDGTITVLIATDDFSVQASDVFEFTSDDTAPTAVPTTGPTATWTSAPTTAPTNAPTAAPTAGRTATANISPEMGGAGTLVTVRGTGFPANTRVNVHMAGLVQAQDGSDSPQPYTYASTITDAGGSYRVSFNMPANWPRGAAIRTGTLTVLVATSDFSIQATDTFEYTAAPPTATPIPTATNTPTPLPTNTPTATPTNTPTNTPLPTATPTNTPTPVPTNTPTATSTPAGQPFVNLEPSAGSPGTLIAITGGGFPANTRVNVYLGTFDEQIGTGDEIIYATAVTTADGAFSTAITLPSAWPDGSVIGSGPIVVLAATDGFAQQASAVLTFNANATPVPAAQAYLTLNPAAGGPGTLVTITGGGFLPNTVVNVYLGAFDEQIGSGDVVSYASAYTDGNGNYGTSIVMPSTWPDGSLVPDGLVLVMVATESFEQRATATFSYTRSTGQPGGQPFAQAQPERGGAGTVVTVSGGNFPPNTTVNLQIAGLVSSQSSESSAQPSVYATTTTGNNGSYVLTFTMPATFASGTPIRSGPLALLVATNDFSTQASAVFEFEGTVSVTPTPAMGILFDDDPRNNQRDVNAYFCSGFESECNFAGCAAGYRLVWGPYCRANDYPYIGTGRYRVTIYGTGNVRVGATDYGTTNDLFAYGDYEINLPGSYTFCWQGREPGGYGFETIVQSLGGYADVQRMVIEYLGPEC